MSIVIDPKVSKRYWKRLEEYFSRNVMGPGPNFRFRCIHEANCRCSAERKKSYSFHPGQLSYVGDGYAVEIDGRPMRILVVPMQVGCKKVIDMDRRREQICERMKESPQERNPHMRGVVEMLQVLFRIESGGEKINDGCHVLEAYAMANSVLCSKLKPDGGRSGSPTSTMLTKCREHLRRTIVLLEPTIIVTQGNPPKKSLKKLADPYEPIRDWTSRVTVARGRAAPVTVARVTVGNVQAVWCNLYHPALRGDYGTYFNEAGVPALRYARELALEQTPIP